MGFGHNSHLLMNMVDLRSLRPGSPVKSNIFFVCVLQVQSSKAVNWWYVDNGCSRHMTGEQQLLLDFVPRKGGYVNFAGAKVGNITGTGC